MIQGIMEQVQEPVPESGSFSQLQHQWGQLIWVTLPKVSKELSRSTFGII